MKKLCMLLCMLISLAGCGSGGSSGDQSSSALRTLALNEQVTDTIATEGEVDWYEFTAVETNRTLNIECLGTYHDSPVAFVVTVYDVDADGNLTPVIGRSAPENAYPIANLQAKVRINGRRTLRIAVRDFKDDNYSDRIPYKLRVFYTDAVDRVDNSNFAQATPVVVGANSCSYDSISDIGEVNCYSFNITSDGVYRVSALFNNPITGTSFNLGLELFNDEGNLIHTFDGPRPIDYKYEILARLVPGDYYLVVFDQGRNQVFNGEYSICITPVAADEVGGNDTLATAESRTPDGSSMYTLDGSLEYIQDQDWYIIDVPADSGANSYNLRIEFQRGFDGDLPESITNLSVMPQYHVAVHDANGTVINEFDQPVDAADLHRVEIGRSSVGNAHYVTVTPNFRYMLSEALPYQLHVTVLSVSDANESLEGALAPPADITGKIFKIGDTDTYTVSVTATPAAPKVLAVNFYTEERSDVSYVLNVAYNGISKVLRDTQADADTRETGVAFKSSFYVDTDTTFTLQVADDQNNSGSQVDYHLAVTLLDVPSALPAIDVTTQSVVGAAPTFFDESDERAATTGAGGTATEVTVVEYKNEGQPEFKADKTLLKVGDIGDGEQWTSDWIGGLVDYDGDRDIFELIFDDVTKGEQWYFDIQVRMYAPASDVEFSWTLFRDGPTPNDILLERTFWSDQQSGVYEYEFDDSGEGVVAAWADDAEDLTADSRMPVSAIVDKTVPVPGSDQEFWIGDGWSQSRFYLSVQDFNKTAIGREWNATGGPHNEGSYVQIPNPVPDNDWSNTAPYFFQVTVTLHDGVSRP